MIEELTKESGEIREIDKESKKENQVFWSFFVGKKIFYFLAIFFFLLVLPFSLFFSSYFRQFFSVFLKRLPYPVAWIKGLGVVTSSELLSDLDSVKIFYRSEDFASQGLRVDFSTQEGKERLRLKEKDILDKLIEDRMVKFLAEEKGIKVTEKEAQQDILEKIKVSGDLKTFTLNLRQNYDWSVNDFRDKIVIPQLYLKRLIVWYQANDTKAQENKQLIEKIAKEVLVDGSNFSELAKKYSEGQSASAGGELGWFRREEMAPEVAEKVFSMKTGETSGVIESSLGWHIVLLEDERQVDGENGEKIKEVKIKQIFLGKSNFLDWLAKEKKRFSVWIFVRDYFWDKNISMLVFRSEEMRSREADLRMKAEGDPSL